MQLFFPGWGTDYEITPEEANDFNELADIRDHIESKTDASTADIVINEFYKDYEEAGEDSVQTSYGGGH